MQNFNINLYTPLSKTLNIFTDGSRKTHDLGEIYTELYCINPELCTILFLCDIVI